MEFILFSNYINENYGHLPQYFLRFILQIVASNIWKDMEEKEKIPYAQGKLLNDALKNNYFLIPDVFFIS